MLPGTQVMVLGAFLWLLSFLQAEYSSCSGEFQCIVTVLKCKYAFPVPFMKHERLSTSWNVCIPSTFDSNLFSLDEVNRSGFFINLPEGTSFVFLYVCMG